MILNTKTLSVAESKGYLDKKNESDAKVLAFIKKFNDINEKDAKEMRKKLEELNMIKMNEMQITKVIDVLPENSEEINKIFIDVNLDEDETKKIVDIVKEFK